MSCYRWFVSKNVPVLLKIGLLKLLPIAKVMKNQNFKNVCLRTIIMCLQNYYKKRQYQCLNAQNYTGQNWQGEAFCPTAEWLIS